MKQSSVQFILFNNRTCLCDYYFINKCDEVNLYQRDVILGEIFEEEVNEENNEEANKEEETLDYVEIQAESILDEIIEEEEEEENYGEENVEYIENQEENILEEIFEEEENNGEEKLDYIEIQAEIILSNIENKLMWDKYKYYVDEIVFKGLQDATFCRYEILIIIIKL